MLLHLIHLDDALKTQTDFLQVCAEKGAHYIDLCKEGRHVRLWGKDRDLSILYDQLMKHFSRRDERSHLCFMGSGDFHHISAFLIKISAMRNGHPITVVHFDNHPDWVRYKGGMHCGSWVHQSMGVPQVLRHITIGVDSGDLSYPDCKGANLWPMAQGKLEVFPWSRVNSRVLGRYGEGIGFEQNGHKIRWKTVQLIGFKKFAKFLLSRIPTDDVYVSVDKDVLLEDSALTNWDQGRMPLSWLLDCIDVLGRNRRIVGADVIGDYSKPVFTGGLAARVLKGGEVFLDHPRQGRHQSRMDTVNAQTNTALLQKFCEVME